MTAVMFVFLIVLLVTWNALSVYDAVASGARNRRTLVSVLAALVASIGFWVFETWGRA